MIMKTPQEWNRFLEPLPSVHILQTAGWGELKKAFGWEPVRVTNGKAGAQILFRKLALGLSLAYIPKGPVGENWEDLWPQIDQICHQKRAIFLKVEPFLWESPEGSQPGNLPPEFTASPFMIQPPRTLVIDLSGEESQILARMKQKTRYNIRLARRKGVVITQSDDLQVFSQLMEITGERDRFGVHSPEYYRKAYELFHPRGECETLVAWYEEVPLAALMVFAYGNQAWYFYGASSNQRRNLMPNYLLQWEAIRWARGQGCLEYDLWGVPDADENVLEAEFSKRSDGLWGVYRFKRGFGGQLRRAVNPWDRVYQPRLYKIYCWWAGRKSQ